MKIGVLALQGSFLEHQQMLERLGVEAVQVRLPEQLDDLNGLIIPGGESADGEAQTLLTLPDGGIVAARQGRLLATSFHPELTNDDRIHRYFLEMAR